MNQAGTTLPAASLRWPVSISWLINTRTVVLSPAAWARMRIGSAMVYLLFADSAAAAAERDLDLFRGVEHLAVGHQRHGEDVRRLAHLDARIYVRLDGIRHVEHGR